MTTNPSAMAPAPRTIWKGFHWAFFVNVQGLILSLLRLEQALMAERQEDADIELRCAAALMRASGAAMKLAGGFSPEAYLADVRASMMAPHVQSDDFSGLMSWDHARLIRLWQKLGPRLGELSGELSEAHGDFLDAFVEMIGSHRAVCQRFVGEERSSLRSCESAVVVLEKVLANRLRIIDPKGTRAARCPFSGHHGGPGAPATKPASGDPGQPEGEAP
ncbi:MAG: siderophore biosynthesis protein [Pseudomonadota bacterium]